jgi:hypothetical protein
MAGTDEDGQEEGAERSQEGDVVRVLSEHLLRHLDHPVHTARSLQDTCAGHGRDDDVDDIRRRGARFQAEAKDKDGETDAGNSTEGEAAVPRANIKGCQDNKQLDNHESHIVRS